MIDYTKDYEKMGQGISDCSESLKSKILEVATLEEEKLGIDRGLEKKRSAFLKDAYDLKDPDGKPQLKNQDMRDSYINERIAELPVSTRANEIITALKKLKAEIAGLEYEFSARKVCMNFVSARLKSQDGA